MSQLAVSSGRVACPKTGCSCDVDWCFGCPSFRGVTTQRGRRVVRCGPGIVGPSSTHVVVSGHSFKAPT